MNNENEKYNKNINEKKIFGLRLSLKNNIKKEIIENNKLNLKKFYYKYEKVLTIFVVTLILLLGIYGFDFIENPRYIKFNYYVANYHTIDRCLRFSNQYSKIIRKNSDISYFFRNILMNKYIIAKKTFGKDFYNSAGLFFSISNDYKLAQSIHYKNEKNLTKNEIERFSNYKQQFLTELYLLLMEYRDRERSIPNFIRLGHWKEGGYRIPNRITFYPELAILYLDAKGHFELNDETLNEFKFIHDTFSIVYNQEKKSNTRSYRTFVNNYSRLDQNQFKTFYPLFIHEYTSLIILLNNDLHPETDICKESDICEKYMSISEKYKFETDSNILNITKRK